MRSSDADRVSHMIKQAARSTDSGSDGRDRPAICVNKQLLPFLSGRASCVVRRTSYVVRRTSCVVRRASHVVRRTSYVVRHTLYVVRRTSHITRRTSYVLFVRHSFQIGIDYAAATSMFKIMFTNVII